MPSANAINNKAAKQEPNNSGKAPRSKQQGMRWAPKNHKSGVAGEHNAYVIPTKRGLGSRRWERPAQVVKQTQELDEEIEKKLESVTLSAKDNVQVPYVESMTETGPAETTSEEFVASSTVWVGNVCREISKEKFQALFEVFGSVVLLRMFRRSKCAFVTFKYARDAVKSLQLEGRKVGSMALTLNVGRASRHLWVGNVEHDVSPLRLRTVFERYGEIESVRTLPVNKSAFVNYFHVRDALRAAEELNGILLGSRKIVINFQWPAMNNKQKTDPKAAFPKKSKQGRSAPAKAKQGRSQEKKPAKVRKQPAKAEAAPQKAAMPDSHATPSRQLFVGNIVPSVTEKTIKDLFSRFGKVEEVKSFMNRGYAFVVYESIRVAMWVREQMNLYPPILGDRPLVVNFGRLPSGNQTEKGYEYHVHRTVRKSAKASAADESSTSDSEAGTKKGCWVFVKV